MKFRQSLFWDTDPKNIDVKKHSRYIIDRILELGDANDIKWMFKTYKLSLIKQVLSRVRGLSSKSANFWADVLGVPKSKVLCLKPSYQKMRKMHWPY